MLRSAEDHLLYTVLPAMKEAGANLAKVHSLVPFIRADILVLLRANGRLEEAENAATEAARLWPGDFRIWRERFYLAALGGNAEQAGANEYRGIGGVSTGSNGSDDDAAMLQRILD